MANIQVLDNSIINQIAAGEVVERPASVVKELVENAIDAGATAVMVEIRDGGIGLIRIVDNGCGIAADEVRSAFLRHATSKIRDMDDLENVLTLGFRGEALSSIAGVAQVEVLTKTADAESGVRLEIHGGAVIAEESAGCADGTTFTVRNLFYNVPARRKFLKKPAAESGQISDMLMRMAVGHPEVAVKYINNATLVLQTNGSGDMKTAVFQVYGREIAEKLVAVDFARDGFRVTGYAARPEMARSNRAYENLFINGRYVKCAVVQSAVEDAYRTRLPIGRFPVFMLRLEMPPMYVDVNVHPTKLEVRFSDERMIYDLMHAAVDKALKAETLIPRVETKDAVTSDAAKNVPVEAAKGAPAKNEPAATVEPAAKTVPQEDADVTKSRSGVVFFNEPFTQETLQAAEEDLQRRAAEAAAAGQNAFAAKPAEEAPVAAAVAESAPAAEKMPAKAMPAQELPVVKETPVEVEPAPKPFFHTYRIVGQAFLTYWIVEQEGSMYLIDQHAAHERVLYEGFLAKLRRGDAIPQSLLMPVAVRLSEREREVVRENEAFLQKLGFEIEELNEQAIAIRALPYVFENPAETGFFMEIVDALADGVGAAGDLYDARLMRVATMACKAAVKANDRLGEAEARALVTQLLTLENPFTCPHGRPTIVELTKYELEKMFKRVQ